MPDTPARFELALNPRLVPTDRRHPARRASVIGDPPPRDAAPPTRWWESNTMIRLDRRRMGQLEALCRRWDCSPQDAIGHALALCHAFRLYPTAKRALFPRPAPTGAPHPWRTPRPNEAAP